LFLFPASHFSFLTTKSQILFLPFKKCPHLTSSDNSHGSIYFPTDHTKIFSDKEIKYVEQVVKSG